jgi:hypothetical protein
VRCRVLQTQRDRGQTLLAFAGTWDIESGIRTRVIGRRIECDVRPSRCFGSCCFSRRRIGHIHVLLLNVGVIIVEADAFICLEPLRRLPALLKQLGSYTYGLAYCCAHGYWGRLGEKSSVPTFLRCLRNQTSRTRTVKALMKPRLVNMGIK